MVLEPRSSRIRLCGRRRAIGHQGLEGRHPPLDFCVIRADERGGHDGPPHGRRIAADGPTGLVEARVTLDGLIGRGAAQVELVRETSGQAK